MADEPEDKQTDPDAEELAALRKEKAERKAAEEKAREEELAELRKYRETNEAAKAKAPKPTAPKSEKKEEPKEEPKKDPKPDDKPSGPSRWFAPKRSRTNG